MKKFFYTLLLTMIIAVGCNAPTAPVEPTAAPVTVVVTATPAPTDPPIVVSQVTVVVTATPEPIVDPPATDVPATDVPATNVPATPIPTAVPSTAIPVVTEPAAPPTLDQFVKTVKSVVSNRDFDAMPSLMSQTQPFAVGLWRSEGVNQTPEEAVAQMRGDIFGLSLIHI